MGVVKVREKKVQEITEYCKQNGIDLINLRHMQKQGKTRIILTFNCKDCNERYDMMWDNVKTQEFPGYCTKCAHKRSQDYRRLQAQDIVNKFEQYGYKVLTPVDKIKPKGKEKKYNKAIVTVENKAGYQFDICYNNFHNRLQHYIELNELGDDAYDFSNRVYEQKVKECLDELGVPYKREFVFTNLRSKENRVLRFDFCLFFTEPEHRMIIEVDERHHELNQQDIKDRDKQKDYYCKVNNIPILRIDYTQINQGLTKDLITKFLDDFNTLAD